MKTKIESRKLHTKSLTARDLSDYIHVFNPKIKIIIFNDAAYFTNKLYGRRPV